jgi:hypothetical protein
MHDGEFTGKRQQPFITAVSNEENTTGNLQAAG